MTSLPRWLRGAQSLRVPFVQVRTPLVRVALLAVLVTLTLDLVRASGPLLDRAFTVGVVAAATAALVTYALPGAFVAVLLAASRSGRGPGDLERRAVPVGVVALAVARIAVQGLDGDARFFAGLAAVALAIGVLTLAVAAVSARAGGGALGGAGVAIGTGLSLALQAGLGTWDAMWRSDARGWIAVAVLSLGAVALALALARSAVRSTAPGEHEPPARVGPPSPGRLWAVGPYLALSAMILANASFLASQTDSSTTAASTAWLMPAVVGLTALSLVPRAADAVLRWSWLAALALPPAVAGVLWSTGAGALRFLLLAGIAAPVVLATALRSPTYRPASALRLALAASATGLGAIVPLLGYQLDYDVPLGFPNRLVIVAAAGALALAGWIRRPRARAETVSPAGASAVGLLTAVVVLLLAVPAVVAPGDAAVEARTPTTSLRLLDWNLHYGVSAEPGVELERIAQTIESSGAEVVTLQEVSRGWVMGGGAEMATWLARRLGMQVVFAPAADRQFGNAILARVALTDVARHPLPYGAGPQRRSAVSATIHLADGTPVRVTSVHLQHRAENTPTRLDQLDVLLGAEPAGGSGSGAGIVAGDLNAGPGSPEIERVTAAGYVSAIDAAGDGAALTSPSDDPVARIDWVFGHGVEFSEVAVLDVALSDHRPVVATLTPSPGTR